MSKPTWITKDRFKDVMKGLDMLTETKVLVGIPQDHADRNGPMNNATIGYIHENGAPEANIPARPHLVPGIRDVQAKIAARFKRLAKTATDLKTGGSAQMTAALNAIGIMGQNAVKKRLTNGPFEPLADSTLRARARSGKGKKSAKAELASRAEGNAPGTLAKPLIHTGQYRNAITYVLRKFK